MEKKLLNALTHCPLFNGISEQGLEQIVASTKHKIVTFDKKDIYILAGMPYRHVDIMVQGEMVARMVSLSGKSVEVIRLVAGNLIAPALIFSKDNLMPVSVETETETTVLRMEKADFVELIDIDPILRRNFITTFLIRLSLYNSRCYRRLHPELHRSNLVYQHRRYLP